MSATVTRLPTAAPSYYTVRKAGRAWAVEIVTPCPIKALRTAIARFADRGEAIAYGEKRAAELGRPFRIGRASR